MTYEEFINEHGGDWCTEPAPADKEDYEDD